MLATQGYGQGGAVCTFGYGSFGGGGPPPPPAPLPYTTGATGMTSSGNAGGVWRTRELERLGEVVVPEFWVEPTDAAIKPRYWLEPEKVTDMQALLQDDDLLAFIRREAHKVRLERELLKDEREEIDMLRESVTEEQKKIEQLRMDLEQDRLKLLEDSAIAMEEKKVVYPPYVMYHGGVPLLGVIPNYEPTPSVVTSEILNDYILPFGKGIVYGAIAGFFIVLLLRLAKDKEP
jgi:hypothetical protein